MSTAYDLIKSIARDMLGWKKFETTSIGTAVLDFSSIGEYKELLVEAFIDNGNNREFFHVPADTLVEGIWLFLRQGGYGGTAATSTNVTVGVQKWKAFLSQAYLSGSDKTSTSRVRVWYR